MAGTSSTDDSLVIDLLHWFRDETDIDLVALVQPTSPFVTPLHIRACLDKMGGASAQTVFHVPHNYHADNQRFLRNGEVRFVSPERAQNKNGKPERLVFANCVAVDLDEAVAQRTPFPEPSVPLLIFDPFRAIDVDGPDDLKLAEAILKAGLV
jgi:CMP-N-acetylneuraminic acid synthetase